MISLNFGLFWSGAPLSYLRYLTFKSLRHFHPHSRIQLFTSKHFAKDDNAGIHEQEFLNPTSIKKDYMNKLEELGVEIVDVNLKALADCYPHQQADIYRWIYLRNHGGIYLDPDQIILRSFKSIPLQDYNFLYSSYKVDSPFMLGDKFCPIGVLGADTKSEVVVHVSQNILNYKEEGNYNALGVIMMEDVINKIDMSEGFNAPPQYFYPAPICDRIEKAYSGKMEIEKDNYSLHWFGGYSPSQKFNQKYTEEFAQTSEDTISKFLRKKEII